MGRSVYGDICQSETKEGLRKILLLSGNNIETAIKILTIHVGDTRIFKPPAFYEQGETKFTPKAFTVSTSKGNNNNEKEKVRDNGITHEITVKKEVKKESSFKNTVSSRFLQLPSLGRQNKGKKMSKRQPYKLPEKMEEAVANTKAETSGRRMSRNIFFRNKKLEEKKELELNSTHLIDQNIDDDE